MAIRGALAWLVLVIYTAALVYSALLQPREIPLLIQSVSDKLLHFLAYAVLAYIALLAFSATSFTKDTGQPVLLALLYGILIGTVTEICQIFVPNRMGEWGDWLMNVLGVSIALRFANMFYKLKERSVGIL